MTDTERIELRGLNDLQIHLEERGFKLNAKKKIRKLELEVLELKSKLNETN